MSDHNYSYTDDNLSLNQAHSYNLLLQVGAGSFDYAITFEKQLLAWAENCPLNELSAPGYLKDVLTANYKDIKIGLSSTGFTLVPHELFDSGNVAPIARLLDVNAHEKIFVQSLDNRNVIVYKAETLLSDAIAGIYTDNVNHKAKGWITAVAGTRPADGSLFLDIAGGIVQFLHFHHHKLRFYNSFSFNNHEELAYYTAFVTEQLGLDAQGITLIISGDINRTDKYFTCLSEFFSDVQLNGLQILEIPPQLQPHRLLTLAALSLCASSEEN